MKASETAMKERGPEYDANCGQEICCAILPKYVAGEALESCYIEISKVIEDFVNEERKAQAEISFKEGEKLSLEKQGLAYLEGKQSGIKEVVEWIKRTYICPLTKTAGLIQVRNLEVDLEAKLKDWGL